MPEAVVIGPHRLMLGRTVAPYVVQSNKAPDSRWEKVDEYVARGWGVLEVWVEKPPAPKPPPPTARDVAKAAIPLVANPPGHWKGDPTDKLLDLARRWDEAGRPA